MQSLISTTTTTTTVTEIAMNEQKEGTLVVEWMKIGISIRMNLFQNSWVIHIPLGIDNELAIFFW